MAFPLSIYSPGGRGRRGGLLIIGKDIAAPPPPTLGKETRQPGPSSIPPTTRPGSPGPLFPEDDDLLPPSLVPGDEEEEDDDPELVVVFDDNGPVTYPDPASLIEWQLLDFTPGSLDPRRTVRVLYAEDLPDDALELYGSVADPDDLDVFTLAPYPGGVFVRFPLGEPVWVASGSNRRGVVVDGVLVPWSVEVARGMIDRLAEVHTKRFRDGSRAYHGNFLNSLFVDAETKRVFLVLLSWIESENGLQKDLDQLTILLEAQGQDAAVDFLDANAQRIIQSAEDEDASRTVQSFYNLLKNQLVNNPQTQ